MPRLAPLTPDDRTDVQRFLLHPGGLHMYLESRLDAPGEGEGLVYREGGRVLGFGWLGKGRNLVLAGDDPAFLGALADYARGRDRDWVMLVGPWDPATDILKQFTIATGRKPRLDRAQVYYAQTRKTLAKLEEPRLRPARTEDLEELVPISARMSSEDFDLDFWRIDKSEVRRRIARKIQDARSWILRDESRILFKVDVAATTPGGAQIEGVYTAEDHRGRGIASRCMAELGRRLMETTDLITLHVAENNGAARKAYERSGYRPGDKLRLTIFPYVW